MKVEKIKEIKKGLECCSKPICEDRCPYHSTRCMSELSKDVLTYINELESENRMLEEEKLSAVCDLNMRIVELDNENNELKSENERLGKELNKEFAKRINAEQTLEHEEKHYKAGLTRSQTTNKKLKDRIAELEEGIAKSMLGCEFLPECTNEKLKQFAEMLKDRLRYTSPTSDVLELSGLEFDGIEVEQCIDETLKEVLGEE